MSCGGISILLPDPVILFLVSPGGTENIRGSSGTGDKPACVRPIRKVGGNLELVIDPHNRVPLQFDGGVDAQTDRLVRIG